MLRTFFCEAGSNIMYEERKMIIAMGLKESSKG